MNEFVTLSCPSCGGKLQITNEIDRFACGYCGNEQMVRRSGGVISLAPVVEVLSGVKAGTDKTASELAIYRLEREIADLEKHKKEIIGNPLPRPYGLRSILILILGSLFLIAGLGGDAWFFFLGLLIMGICSVTIFAKYKGNQRKIAEMQEKLNPLESALLTKKKTLLKHQQVVST